MDLREHALAHDGVLLEPVAGGNGTGVLVLSGSSGRVERDRARLLARSGVSAALTYRWFGGDGQPAGIWEYPLESFAPAVASLAERCDRVVLLGVSKSAEAFLLYAADDPVVDAVVALAPSHVAWANVGPGPDGELRPQHSSWSRNGEPVPFVPYDDDAEPVGDPPAFAPVYAQSLRTAADRVPAATIPVERFFGDVLLVAGGDDRVWPSVTFARAVAGPAARPTTCRRRSSRIRRPDIASSSPARRSHPADSAWRAAAPRRPTAPSASRPGPRSAGSSTSPEGWGRGPRRSEVVGEATYVVLPMWGRPPQNDAGEVSPQRPRRIPAMLSPHIVSALAAMREADLRRQAEVARRSHVEPAPEALSVPTRRRRARAGRRRHLRLV